MQCIRVACVLHVVQLRDLLHRLLNIAFQCDAKILLTCTAYTLLMLALTDWNHRVID
jgi:hypothetical protein